MIDTRRQYVGWLVDGSLATATVLATLLALSVARGQLVLTSAGPIVWSSVVAPPADARVAQAPFENLRLVVDGVARPLTSGEEVALGENRRVRITVIRPDATREDRLVDTLVITDDGQARPVDGLTIRATARMPGMDAIESVGVAGAAGHYLMPLPLTMPGTWQVELTVVGPGFTRTVQLEFQA